MSTLKATLHDSSTASFPLPETGKMFVYVMGDDYGAPMEFYGIQIADTYQRVVEEQLEATGMFKRCESCEALRHISTMRAVSLHGYECEDGCTETARLKRLAGHKPAVSAEADDTPFGKLESVTGKILETINK